MPLTLVAGTSLNDGLDEPLSYDEKQLRRKSEAKIRKAAELLVKAEAAYVEAGAAFKVIRDGDLYRNTHKTFELYCKETWRSGHRKVNRLIAASEVAMILGPIGPIPAKESVARELVPLLDNPQKLSAIWENVVQDAEDHQNRRITANWLHNWLEVNQALEGQPTPSQILNHSGKPATKPSAPKPSQPGDDLLGTPSASVPVMDEDPWLYVLAALDVANGKPNAGTVRPPLSDARRKMLLRALRKAVTILEGE